MFVTIGTITKTDQLGQGGNVSIKPLRHGKYEVYNINTNDIHSYRTDENDKYS